MPKGLCERNLKISKDFNWYQYNPIYTNIRSVCFPFKPRNQQISKDFSFNYIIPIKFQLIFLLNQEIQRGQGRWLIRVSPVSPCLSFGGTWAHEGYPLEASQSNGSKRTLIKKLIIWEICFFLIVKHWVWTKTARLSLWLQRHKSVTEKSQACGCKVTKRRVIMQQINYSTRMIVVCVEPAETLLENLCDQSQGAAVLWKKRAMSSMGARVGDSKGSSVSMRSRKFSQHDYLLKTN